MEMDTFFIRTTDDLAKEVFEEIARHYGLGLYVSPRGQVLNDDDAVVYGIYINDFDFVANYGNNGGVWSYVLVDRWVDEYRAKH
jgi:hypothetical protein